MPGRAACAARAEGMPVCELPSFLPRCPIDAIIAMLASYLAMPLPVQHVAKRLLPARTVPGSLATQVASTLLTVSLYVRMICGEPSLQAEATVAFKRRARAVPDVIRGPYPSTRRRTRFLPHPIILSSRSPDSHANKKLAGSISRTSHLQLFRHRATYMAFASVRYAWVSVHSVRFVSTGSGEGSSLGQVLHTRFLAFVITHHIRCLYHSHFPPTASIPSHCTFIYHSLGRRRHHSHRMITRH